MISKIIIITKPINANIYLRSSLLMQEIIIKNLNLKPNHITNMNTVHYLNDLSNKDNLKLLEKSLHKREDFLDKNTVDKVANDINNDRPILFLANYVCNHYLKNCAQLLLIGHTYCGSKTAVILDKIDIYADLFCAQECINHNAYSEANISVNVGIVKQLLVDSADFKLFYNDANNLIKQHDILKQKYICKQIFQVGSQEYYIGIRVYFKTEKLLKSFVYEAYKNENILVASYNETKLFERIGAQYGIYIGAWSVLKKYRHNNESYFSTKAKYNLYVDIDNYLPANISILQEYNFNVDLLQVKSLYMYFDIETTEMSDRPINNNNTILSETNHIFNIGVTIAFENDKKKSLVNYGIINFADGNLHKIDGDNNSITYVTTSHLDNLLVFMLMIKNLQPDFIAGYNILDFDLPQILMTLRVNNLFDYFYSEISLLNIDNYESLNDCKIIDGCKYLFKKSKDSSSANYTFWNKVYTTSDVSGITSIDASHGENRIRMPGKLKQFKIKNGVDPNYHYMEIPGCILLDVYLISWKKHPNDNVRGGKMDYYLKKYGIKQKLDMPYWKIWATYKQTKFDASTALSAAMNDIREYCIYDAFAAKLLIDSYDYMMEKRKYCEFVYFPLQSNIYKADTSKVESGLRYTLYQNDFIAIEHKFSESDIFTKYKKVIMESNQNLKHYHITEHAPKNKGGYCAIHYSGKVTALYKGHRFVMPVEAEDFSSLYPSIEETYNMCLSTIVTKKEFCKESIQYHDFTSEDFDPYYNKYKIYVKKHNNDRSKYGILPLFLSNMKIERNKIKAAMNASNDITDRILKEFQQKNPYNDNDYASAKDYISYCRQYLFDNNDEYRTASINFTNQNQGQNAVKVTMNSTYGYTDYEQSLFYAPIIAMLTTYFGRQYIQYANEICEQHGKVVLYNDTDSVYFHHSVEIFADIFDRYLSGELTKLQLNKKLVRRSIKHSSARSTLNYYYADKLKKFPGDKKILANLNDKTKTFEDILNESYINRSGSNILKQVREETLFPAVFLMKKKYFGKIHHTEYVDKYGMANLLIRGLASRSGACTGFLRQFIESLYFKIIDEDEIEIKDLIMKLLNELYDYKITDDNLHLFEKVGRYKANKKNSVHELVARIKHNYEVTLDKELKELYKIPSELESVYYIYTKPKNSITVKGTNLAINKGDSAEYKEVISYLKLEVDLDDYIKSTLSTCAQFLTYDKSSDLYVEGITNKDYVAAIKKHLEKYCKEISKNSAYEKNKVEYKKKYKQFFSSNIKAIYNDLRIIYPSIYYLLHEMINFDYNANFHEMIKVKLLNYANNIGAIKMSGAKYISDYREQSRRYFNNQLSIFDTFEKYINKIRDEFANDLLECIKNALENNTVIQIPELLHEEYIELYSKQLKQYMYSLWFNNRAKLC